VELFFSLGVTTLHVSDGSSAHHQQLKTVYTASGIVEAPMPPTAIVSELELTHDSGKKQKNLHKYPMPLWVCIHSPLTGFNLLFRGF